MPPINQDYMFYPHDQCIEESAAGIGRALDLTTGLAESYTLLDVIQRGVGLASASPTLTIKINNPSIQGGIVVVSFPCLVETRPTSSDCIQFSPGNISERCKNLIKVRRASWSG